MAGLGLIVPAVGPMSECARASHTKSLYSGDMMEVNALFRDSVVPSANPRFHNCAIVYPLHRSRGTWGGGSVRDLVINHHNHDVIHTNTQGQMY